MDLWWKKIKSIALRMLIPDRPLPPLPLTYACLFAAGMGVAAMALGREKVVIKVRKTAFGLFDPDCCESVFCVPNPLVIEAGRLALKFTRNYNDCSWSDSIYVSRKSPLTVQNAKIVLLTYWPDVAGLAQILCDTTKDGTQLGSYRLLEIGLKFEDYPSFLRLIVDEEFERTATWF